MTYEGIIFSGRKLGARPATGYRLRTAAKVAGYDVLIIDISDSLTLDTVKEILSLAVSDNTKFIGFSSSWVGTATSSYDWVCDELFDHIKVVHPGLLIITGNHNQPTSSIYKISDYHFSGFSDASFTEFLHYINNKPSTFNFTDVDGKKVVYGDNKYPLASIDDIENILYDYDLFEPYQSIPIEISRGCIYRCSFCAHPYTGKKGTDYIRSSESIALELKRNYDLFGVTRYSITDDTFNDSMFKLDVVDRAVELSGIPSFEFSGYIKPELLGTVSGMGDKLGRLGLRGGHVGIESINNVARKAIGKSTDVEKVIDSIRDMTSVYTSMQLCASFIFGLPGDTTDDFYKIHEFCSGKDNDIFSNWMYYPLGIHSDPKFAFTSIEKNPIKFGYNTSKKLGSWYNWTTSTSNYVSAMSISNKLMNESANVMKFGGWTIPDAWSANLGNNEILTQSEKSLRSKYIPALRSNEEYRLNKLLERLRNNK